MSDIQIFNNPEFGGIRVRQEGGEILFVAVDIARALNYANPAKAVIDHCKGVSVLETPTQNQHGATVMQNVKYIRESEVYRLIMKSKTDSAEKFQDWVCEEVLPSIRKHGMYATENTIDNILSNPDFGIRLLQTLKEEREAKKALEIENKKKGEQIALMQDTIKEMEGKVSYLDKIFACPSTVKVKVIAQDYGMSAIAFNQLLHSMGIQYKDGKNWILYRRYIDKGYVKDVPFEYERKDGTKAVKSNTQWTQKGRAFLYEFLKSNLILPLIEQ